ncbi:rhomboid family intramembrane serine protease [Butyrivibrio sp. WCD3002]|uniref:rhomboid family intramembrane serine protease n=1 Tax=Butyrivibrio sp. WCD3002 TaxID=1280676 RepID=UPI0006853FBA|nr:rhomboid family intramembrane serine protease [Butyrivibrio sp. WCD3002]
MKEHNDENLVEEVENEDYRLEEDPMQGFWKRQTQIFLSSYINIAIIACNVIIFVYGFFAGYDFQDRFDFDPVRFFQNQEYYRLFTSMFLHASLEHIGSNMLILFFIGANAEHDLGHISYLFVYLISGLAGDMVSLMDAVIRNDLTPSLGASGAIFGVIGAVLIIVIYGRKNLRPGSNLLGRLIAIICLSVYSGFREENIDNAAHIGGLIGGIIITFLITKIFKKEYTMEEWL